MGDDRLSPLSQHWEGVNCYSPCQGRGEIRRRLTPSPHPLIRIRRCSGGGCGGRLTQEGVQLREVLPRAARERGTVRGERDHPEPFLDLRRGERRAATVDPT